MHSATIVTVLVTLPRTAQRKCPHQKHFITVIDHTLTIAATAEAFHTLSITDVGRVTTLTGQGHTTDLNVTETPVTTGDIHPALYHTTAVACDIHPETDTQEGTHTGTPHTITDVTHP